MLPPPHQPHFTLAVAWYVMKVEDDEPGDEEGEEDYGEETDEEE